MNSLLSRLNFKGQKEIFVINHPAEFNAELASIQSETTVKTELNNTGDIEFILAFVKNREETDTLFHKIKSRLEGDAVLWIAYPKKTSKKYKADINRDKGWETLFQADWHTVRAVAIDEDWSTLRFRNRKYIKVMSRQVSV